MVGARQIVTGVICLGFGAVAIGKLLRLLRTRHKKRTIIISRGHPVASYLPNDVSIVSYNILADHYSSSPKLSYANPRNLSWESRWPLLERELASFQSDFICLQEVDISRWEEVKAWPGLSGYQGLIQDKAKDHFISNAIFYKSDRFEVFWVDHRTRALLAGFTWHDGDGQQQVLYIINVHLEGSPYRPNDRVSQMRSALNRVSTHITQCGWTFSIVSVIVAGDFNSGREASVWHFLYRGRLDGGTTEPQLPQVPVTKTSISHPFLLSDAYMVGGAPLPFTRCLPGFGHAIDYIFASEDMYPVALLWPLDKRHVHLLGVAGMPNAIYPSDHLPVGVVLRFNRTYVQTDCMTEEDENMKSYISQIESLPSTVE